MKKLIVILNLFILLCSATTAHAEDCSNSTNCDELQQESIIYEDISLYREERALTRASQIVLLTSWDFDANYCSFTVDFLEKSTGSMKVTLQKQSGSSWSDKGSVTVKFTNMWYADSNISVNSLASGVYRLKIDVTANSISEIYYTRTKTI